MIIRELKINFKSFAIWTFILLLLFKTVFEIYPSIVQAATLSFVSDMINMLPPEIVKAFNFDLSGIETTFGWLKSEGFVFILLITGVYSAMLGSNILLKEENDKTVEYLNSLPITRTKIVLKKYFVGLFYILLMIGIIAVYNYYGLKENEVFDENSYWLLSITPIFSSIVIYTLCLFLSTFFHKTRAMLGIGLGIVFIGYILNVFSSLGESSEFLKYFSVFTLADIRNVISNVQIDPIILSITIGLTLVFFVLTIFRYNKKELV